MLWKPARLCGHAGSGIGVLFSRLCSPDGYVKARLSSLPASPASRPISIPKSSCPDPGNCDHSRGDALPGTEAQQQHVWIVFTSSCFLLERPCCHPTVPSETGSLHWAARSGPSNASADRPV